ncbi:MAG: flagellar motor switch protein FliN [Candidatus Neomarinimicrobiota bacterium]
MAQEFLSVLGDATGKALQGEVKLVSGEDAAELTPEFAPGHEFPLLRVTLNTTGQGTYDHQFLMDRSLAGLIFSWMVGGDPPDEIGEEHLDAVKEGAGQIVGQLQAAFDGEEGAFTPGDIAIAEVATAEDLTLPEGGLVATYRFTRGEDETEYTITHLIQGELAEGAAAEAPAEEGAEVPAEAAEEGAEVDIDDLIPDDFGEEVEASLEGKTPAEGIEDVTEAVDMGSDPTEMDDIFGDDFPEPASTPDVAPVEASPTSFDEFGPARPTNGKSRQIDLLLDVELDVSVELGRKVMLVEEILRLGKGSVVELDKLAGEPVDILINGKKLAEGEVVVVEDHFGVRLTHLLDPEERIKSLGR